MKLNQAALTGFLLCLVALIYGVMTNGGLEAVTGLLHLPSAIVTFGGSFFAVLLTADSFADFSDCIRSFRLAFRTNATSPEELTKELLRLAGISRKEGLLALEVEAETPAVAERPFLKKALMLIIDGSDPDLTRDILESELYHTEDRNKAHVTFWETLGSYGPAWGMIGTLLGLINMMAAMGDDIAAVGPAMSLALLTTLYGSILANWICAPVARKLEKNGARESLFMEIIIEGVLSIQAGENVRMIEEKLRSVAEMGDLGADAAES